MTHIVSDVSVQWRIMVLGAGQTDRQTDHAIPLGAGGTCLHCLMVNPPL